MSYVTGTVNNVSDLRTAIFNACVANGWTLSGEVLHKGTAYFRLQVVGNAIQLLGGTGKDGGNNLTGAANGFVIVTGDGGIGGITYPAMYNIHINSSPDEVYAVIGHSTDYHQWLAFGQSHITFSSGTGNWFGASYGSGQYAALARIAISANDSGTDNCCALFWKSGSAGYTTTNSHVHHGLNGGNGWTTSTELPNAITALVPLVGIAPNAFNGEALLLPIPVMVTRPSTRYSLVAQPKHARYIRMDYHDPGQILTIGSEQWKVYPWMKKDSTNRNGGANITHSGTFGWAIRYTP